MKSRIASVRAAGGLDRVTAPCNCSRMSGNNTVKSS